jgi:integrase/recombinase XerC
VEERTTVTVLPTPGAATGVGCIRSFHLAQEAKVNVLEASHRYIDQVQKSRSPLTAETYRYSLKAFVKYVTPEVDCGALRQADFTSFISNVLKGVYAKSTMGLYAAVIRNFMKYLVSEDLTRLEFGDFVKVDYMLEACRSVRPPRKPKVPSDAEVQAVMQAAYAPALPSPLRERNIALVECLYCTGCRISEIAGLEIHDIDLLTGQATILGKGRKIRPVYLSPRALEACLAYWRARGDQSPSSPAFARHDDGAGGQKPLQKMATTGLRNAINTLRLQAGVKAFTPHSFRHYYATRLLRETGNLAIVQDALGHVKPDTTRVYAQLDEAAVRLAVQQTFRESPSRPVEPPVVTAGPPARP